LAARVQERRKRREGRGELVWTRGGTVWARDHTEFEAPIDGEVSFLPVVGDLASGRVLPALPTPSTDHGPVAAELERLFTIRDAPLVLNVGNGSGLVHVDVRKLQERWPVTSLRSPPLITPTLNSSV
jgi:hypothetical protein